jgi:hypothetical protein
MKETKNKTKKLDWWVDDKALNHEPSRFYLLDMYFDNDVNLDNEYHDNIPIDEVYLREKDFERVYDNLNMKNKFSICDIKLNEKNNNLFDITIFVLTSTHPTHISETYYFLKYDYTYDPIRRGRLNVFLLRYPIIMQGLNINLVRNAFTYYKVMWDEYDLRFNEWHNEIRRNQDLINDILTIINNKKNVRALVRIEYKKIRNAIWNPSENFLNFNYSKDPLKFIDHLYKHKKSKKSVLLNKTKPVFEKINYEEILKKFF